MCVCMYVCMCVHSYLPPHTLESQKRDTNGLCAIQGSFKFADFPKNASFKSYGSSGVLALFSKRNKLLCWFEAYSYVFTAHPDNGPVEDSVRFFGTDS